ncbi:oligosaccharide flippase family protein [Pseudomonas fragi]|uniref:oligosaccharide flippase family protein n=1 Tax=Pseudomonas fragi TaxID=296 RepID=UPI002955833D|nr:oligosaccharide flippase family protein [Pseudomonas fragi]WOL29971.1 oligosaccharide flippase family protein [Pseudomonas fragi]
MLDSTRNLKNNVKLLFTIQLANYLLPLLLIPYLTQVLGVPLYGLIAFGMAIIQIGCIITDYGFSLSATYQIAKSSHDRLVQQKIIAAVFTLKALLLIPVLLALGLFIAIEENYQQHASFFWLLILTIIGQTFQPIWFFQGIEKMGAMTIYTLLSRFLYLGLVFLLVDSPADYELVAVANGTASICAAIVAISLMIRLGYNPRWGGWAFVRSTFHNSTEFFWSRAAVATYTAGGAFFLGLVSTTTQVAYYSAAEQLYKGAQSIFQPVAQALYPYMAKNKNFKLFFKVLGLIIILSLVELIVGYFIGPFAIELLFGKDFSPSYAVLIIFLITSAVTAPSILLGYPFLGALGNSKDANLSVMYASIIQLALLVICYNFNLTSAVFVALSVLTVEIFVLGYRAVCAKSTYYSYHKGITK